MTLSRTARLLLAGAAVVATSCITVNIYFPAPEVRLAAEQIVEETWGGDGAQAPATPSPAAPGASWSLPFGPRAAYAADVDVNVSTAAIRALKEQMKKRSTQLKPYLDQARLGITKDGMLAVRNLDGVALRDQASVRRLVEAENSDRSMLYKEINTANDFGPERLGDIQNIFAETWIAKAEKGWPIQKPDGSWTIK